MLDVGSGKGKFLCEMAKRGFKVHGVEVNPDYIEAKSQAVKEGVAIQVINTQAESLPFPNDYFNFVNCAEVTETCWNIRSEPAKEIYRVLKPGGYGYISFHNRFGFYDYHYHLHFINWLPRSVAEFILFFFKQTKDGFNCWQTKIGDNALFYVWSD